MPKPGDIRVNRINTASLFMKLHLVAHREEYGSIYSTWMSAMASSAGYCGSSQARAEEKLPEEGHRAHREARGC